MIAPSFDDGDMTVSEPRGGHPTPAHSRESALLAACVGGVDGRDGEGEEERSHVNACASSVATSSVCSSAVRLSSGAPSSVAVALEKLAVSSAQSDALVRTLSEADFLEFLSCMFSPVDCSPC
jgi:hypothetical protein